MTHNALPAYGFAMLEEYHSRRVERMILDRKRKFDWIDAHALHTIDGWSFVRIARRFGVTPSAVQQAVHKVAAAPVGSPISGDIGTSIVPRMYQQTKVDIADMKQMLADGTGYQPVALKYGVSRERVRQLANKHGVCARTSRKAVAKRRIEIIEAIKSGLSDEEIKARYRAPPVTLYKIRRKLGMSDFQMAQKRTQKAFEPYVAMVAAGRSMNSIQNEYNLPRGRLDDQCKKAGVKSQHLSNNPRYRGETLAPELDPKEIEPYVSMVAAGRSMNSVQKEYNLPRGRLAFWCKKAGVKSQHPSKNPSGKTQP